MQHAHRRCQAEFDFSAEFKAADGLTAWREQRAAALRKLTSQLGLPLGHPVEVWIRGGIRLCGTLELHEDLLILDDRRDLSLMLRVEGVPFTPREVESCVRLDD